MPTTDSESTSSKRPAPPSTTSKAKKRRRDDVHPLQKELAERASEHNDGTIIAASMGSGKPRIAGAYLDIIVPKLVAGRADSVPGVLAVVVATDVKHGREQATQFGTDFPGPYHDSELGAALRLLKGDGHSARIMMPLATFRKKSYWPKKGTSAMWALLESLGQPDVLFLIDEVTTVYKPDSGRLPKAIAKLRQTYRRVTEASIKVIGMSGTPALEDAKYADRAATLFGRVPTQIKFEEEEQKQLLDEINPQLKVSERRKISFELPDPELDDDSEGFMAETCGQLNELLVGNVLFNDIRGATAVKKLAGDMLAFQVLEDEEADDDYCGDGGVLFQHLARESGRVEMLAVNKDGRIGKKTCRRFETVLIAGDSPYSAQALLDRVKKLQERAVEEDSGELRAFTVHDLRLEAQIKATKEADKVPHAYLKRDVADQKAALKGFFAAAAQQKGTTIAIIDKSQALSGTNDFSKNVQRAIAIGAWEPHELDQFYKRLCRPCELKEGDFVSKEFVGVHIAPPPFAAELLAKPELGEGVEGGDILDEEDRKMHRWMERAKGLNLKLPGDGAVLNPEEVCNDLVSGDDADRERFKADEYLPLIEHHKDCDRVELDEVDQATGEKKMKVVRCCELCKCVFEKADGDAED